MSKKNNSEPNRKLLLIEYLYREQVDSQELYELLSDPENLEEFEVLKRVKHQLENRALRREVLAPEEVIDRVLLIAKQKSRRTKRRSILSVPRLALIGSMTTVAVIALVMLLPTTQKDNDLPTDATQVSSQLELQWDDTQERIEMQQALNIVRQRTSPDLWDESEVIRLDSLSDDLTSTRTGVQTTRSTPQ